MPPLSDRDRITFNAIGLLETGSSQAQAATRLQERFPFLSAAEATEHVRQAVLAQANAVGASFAGDTGTVGGAAGRPDEPSRKYVVEFLVRINNPDREQEVRTVRFSAIGADTIAELTAIVLGQMADWDELYSVDGSSSTYELRYIL